MSPKAEPEDEPTSGDGRRGRSPEGLLSILVTAVVSLLLGGGGGFLSYRDLGGKLDLALARLDEVRAQLNEAKGDAKGLETRVRDLERTVAELRAALSAAHKDRP